MHTSRTREPRRYSRPTPDQHEQSPVQIGFACAVCLFALLALGNARSTLDEARQSAPAGAVAERSGESASADAAPHTSARGKTLAEGEDASQGAGKDSSNAAAAMQRSQFGQ